MVARLVPLLSLAFVLLFAVPAFAQDGPPPAPKRAAIEAKLEQIRARMLRAEVGLSEAKAQKVEAIMAKHQAERQALKQKMQGHRQALGGLLRQDSDDQAAYAREIKGMRETHQKIQGLRNREIDELQKVLTPKEQAKLGAAMEQMKRQLQQAMRHHRGGGPPPR